MSKAKTLRFNWKNKQKWASGRIVSIAGYQFSHTFPIVFLTISQITPKHTKRYHLRNVGISIEISMISRQFTKVLTRCHQILMEILILFEWFWNPKKTFEKCMKINLGHSKNKKGTSRWILKSIKKGQQNGLKLDLKFTPLGDHTLDTCSQTESISQT